MRYPKEIIAIALLLFMLAFPLLAQHEVSYRIVLDETGEIIQVKT